MLFIIVLLQANKYISKNCKLPFSLTTVRNIHRWNTNSFTRPPTNSSPNSSPHTFCFASPKRIWNRSVGRANRSLLVTAISDGCLEGGVGQATAIEESGVWDIVFGLSLQIFYDISELRTGRLYVDVWVTCVKLVCFRVCLEIQTFEQTPNIHK